MPAQAALALVGAGRRDGRRWVLRGVDLRLPATGIVVVRGPNGSGKSTLLRLAAGVSAPSEGRVVRARGLRVGLLPERPAATAALRAGALLAHLARLRGCPPGDGDALAERLGARDLLGARLGELSEGQLQRVALVGALAGEPGLVVLDEPWRGLDAGTGQELGRLLADRGRRALVLVGDHGGTGRPAAARMLELGGGGVVERVAEDAPPPLVRVRTGAAGRLPGPLAARARPVAGGWELDVAPTEVQEALRALLAAGVEILEVRP